MKTKSFLLLFSFLALHVFSSSSSGETITVGGLGIGSGSIVGKNLSSKGETVIQCAYKGGSGKSGSTARICSATVPARTKLELTATAGSGSHFGGWRGATGSPTSCNAVIAPCKFVLIQNSSLKAFLVIPLTVAIIKDGTGTGTVEGKLFGVPPGPTTVKIVCPPALLGCTLNTFSDLPTLEFTATANSDSAFIHWDELTGSAVNCNPQANICTFQVQANTVLKVTFVKVVF